MVFLFSNWISRAPFYSFSLLFKLNIYAFYWVLYLCFFSNLLFYLWGVPFGYFGLFFNFAHHYFQNHYCFLLPVANMMFHFTTFYFFGYPFGIFVISAFEAYYKISLFACVRFLKKEKRCKVKHHISNR